ncbi:hypothetical protein P154DRAFT_531014 [Amniculicola lignicola CBS 123094]|uniref:Uncharacterized protein n=1 Tax=Amniculicola lignicola CBS 123094 TaxID=1392246 RepID=A0A6A5WUQ9_9PLEO|nr:hypothetical protein P154DRAFT_531014 [Amniculicola lignicola CBS 123094]
MATTRLRQTFRYPADDSDDEVEQGMDEQDQETLLTTLSTHDTSSTRLYTHLLLLLPLSPILLYLPQLLSLSTTIPSLAAITSLLASAYTLYFLPLPPVRADAVPDPTLNAAKSGVRKGKAILRDETGGRGPSTVGEVPVVPFVSEEVAEGLAKYTILVNGVLVGMLTVVELWSGRSWSEGMMIGGGYVPGFVMGVIMYARRALRVVDLGELERLRYWGKSA